MPVGLGALDEQHRECTGFLIMPSAHMNGVWIRMAVTNLTMLRLALVPGISLLTSLFSSTFATPIYPDLALSCVVSRHNKEDLSADTTKNEYRDDVHDRALVHQGHVSVSFLTLLRLPVSLLLVCSSLHLH